ncbi:serine/threonine protein phosphatase 2A 57 kDa regulatory subunit B' alpha isoform-like [Lolium rigidum]|uniref:serine/threonine protein phosphatase 2A 57 kDa regulatory subunit B' alpha isoform-like n=1 Tax=Lolium rigidum TaxID=89674 RepID=UPI001F5DC7F8|nr:serine/threonine protein phosphatase 2A 57 kDa regulatory subunit B' alpha isoform-like [Lolium rigidum]
MGAEVEAVRAPAPPGGKRRSTTLLHLLNLEKPDGVFVFTTANAVKLPPPSPEPEAESLIDKIDSCCRVFTFADAEHCADQRDLKRARLAEILSAVRSTAKSQNQPPGLALDHRVMAALVKMLAANLFRAMPPPPPSSFCPLADAGTEEDLPSATSLLPSWPHLSTVYDILLAAIAAADAKSLRAHVDRRFLASLLALFASEDPRERDRLKAAYHALYSKLTPERAFMRRSMSHALLRLAHDAPSSSPAGGVGEVLEICGSIINGFAVPLKDEHRGFLLRVLLPLHRTRWLHAYHRQLVYCVLQFLHKDPGLAGAVVQGVLRRWPVTNCQKEVLLIDELEEIVDALGQHHFDALALPICNRIARCATSCSSQVAERALYVWNNERFLEMATSGEGTMERILPAFVASIEANLEQHWSKCVQQVTASVKTLLQQVAPELYDRCVADLAAKRAEADAEAAIREARWRRLEAAAAGPNAEPEQNCS